MFWVFLWGCFWIRLTFNALSVKNILSIMWVGLIKSVEGLHRAKRLPSPWQERILQLPLDFISNVGSSWFYNSQPSAHLLSWVSSLWSILQIFDLPASGSIQGNSICLFLHVYTHPIASVLLENPNTRRKRGFLCMWALLPVPSASSLQQGQFPLVAGTGSSLQFCHRTALPLIQINCSPAVLSSM